LYDTGELLKELRKKREVAVKEGDIVGLYDVLDAYLAMDLEGEEIDELYELILQNAFDKLADKLTRGERFDLENEVDVYSARAIYEHALERWDSKDFKGANELFLVLSYLVEGSIQKSMILGLALTAKRVGLDEFLNDFVDRKALDESSLFFDRFTAKADRFLSENSLLVESELKKIDKIAAQ